MPYLLPSNLTGNEEISSVCVHYPDKPEFKSALLGALTFFTKWVAWERTDDYRAMDAAMLWYKAHELTIADWEKECGDCGDCMTEDEIRDLINQELENMTINNCITVNCGCGTCGTGAPSGIDSVPPVDYVPPEPEPLDEPEQPAPTSDYLQYRCNATHYLYFQFRSAVLQLGTLKETGSITMEQYDEVVTGTLGFLGTLGLVVWEVYYAIVSWLLGRVSESGAEMAQIMDANYDLFICAIYNADGVNDMRERFLAVIEGLPMSWAGRYWLKLLEQNIVWSEWLYYEDWEEVEFPPSYQSRTCDCEAGATPPFPEPEPDTGLMWIPAEIGTITAYGTGGQSYNRLVSQFGDGIQIYGSDHPGNVAFGYNIVFDNMPEVYYALAIKINGEYARVMPYNQSQDIPDLWAYNSSSRPEPDTVSYMVDAAPEMTQDIVDWIEAQTWGSASQSLLVHNKDRNAILLGVDAGSALDGIAYDVRFFEMQWLVPYVGE